MITWILLVILVIAVLYYNTKESFSNIILRPLDFTHFEQTGCKHPLLKDVPGLKFCNPKIDKYYDIRPILHQKNYHELLQELVDDLQTPTISLDNTLEELSECVLANFEIQNFLNKQISSVVKNNPAFHNNGSFKFESIVANDIDAKFFKDSTGTVYIKVLFTLYDLTRSAGTQAYALIAKNNNLNIERAGLVYPDIERNNNVKPGQAPQGFDIFDSLSTVELNKYVNVPSDVKIEGGISDEMSKLIDVYFQYN